AALQALAAVKSSLLDVALYAADRLVAALIVGDARVTVGSRWRDGVVGYLDDLVGCARFSPRQSEGHARGLRWAPSLVDGLMINRPSDAVRGPHEHVVDGGVSRACLPCREEGISQSCEAWL